MPQTELQKSKGIKDSPELMAKDMIKAGRGFNHPDLARTLTEQAHTVYPMLMECGVKLMDKVIRLGGHSAPRAHIPTNASGGGVVVPMHNWLLKEGIEFRNRTCVEEIVRDGSEVLGVNVRKDYDWRNDTDKGTESLRARLGGHRPCRNRPHHPLFDARRARRRRLRQRRQGALSDAGRRRDQYFGAACRA
jgi:hypothetical protein